nr:transposase [Nocardia neocaledoniensis]
MPPAGRVSVSWLITGWGGHGVGGPASCTCRAIKAAEVVGAGQAGSSPQFQAVLDGISVPKLGGGRARTRPGRVLTDNAYSSHGNREWLRRRGINATIPVPADHAGHRRRRGGRSAAFDPVLNRNRNAVERGINRSDSIGGATRLDKLAWSYQATIHIAHINQWLRYS